MDPRRLLSAVALIATLAFGSGGCALFADRPSARAQTPAPVVVPTSQVVDPFPSPRTIGIPAPRLEPAAPAEPEPEPALALASFPVSSSTARPYLEVAGTRREADGASPTAPDAAPHGRAAIAAANRRARAASSADAFVGGVQVFAWEPGRVYEVWTAPLRVTSLTFAPDETVTAKAAGDTVRWQIGESVSGTGAGARTHVLIKPLQTGLETNLVLTTSQRVYLLTLHSGDADAFNAAIAWDDGMTSQPTPPVPPGSAVEVPLPPVDVEAATPQGPLDARYRIQARGRAPRWAPTAVFNDGVRTFIALSADVAVDETPALFVMAGGEAQLVNYRQADGLLIVDRVFDEAELRLGDHRPQIVRIHRIAGAAR